MNRLLGALRFSRLRRRQRAASLAGTERFGGDAMLYSSINDSKWIERGMPNGEGGNGISRAVPCPVSGGQLLPDKDLCSWEEMPGAAVRIPVGTTAWVSDAQGQVFEWWRGGGGY